MSEQAITVDWRAWTRDGWLLAAILVAIFVRVAPILIWPQFDCIRDECIYRGMAYSIIDGEGLTTSQKGWLAAPGYPYLLAWSKQLFGTMQAVKVLQIFLSLGTLFTMYGIGQLVADRKAARIAAFLFALNPTLAWFTNTMWIETIYIFFLMAAGMMILVAHRTKGLPSAFTAGAMLGGAILFRGIATYLPPLFVLALAWPELGESGKAQDWVSSARGRWKAVLAFLAGILLMVSPYSMYASSKHGGFMVTDATVGHVLFLGNNDFPPLTFDYGIGMLTQPLYGRYLKTGRRPCRRDVPPVQSSKCEVRQTVAWIQEHPDKFLARIPMRLAQNLNPNSFLTRHIRWGYWPGLPWWAKEGLAVLIVLYTAALAVLGTLEAWARAKGPWAYIAIGTAAYTMATTAIMYGMTRFRLPIEALWTIYLAMFLANPRGAIEALRESPARTAGALLTIPPIVALMLWYLPTGFPMFWR